MLGDGFERDHLRFLACFLFVGHDLQGMIFRDETNLNRFTSSQPHSRGHNTRSNPPFDPPDQSAMAQFALLLCHSEFVIPNDAFFIAAEESQSLPLRSA